MHVQKIQDSPRNHRGDGQTSYLLLDKGQFGSRHLSITWVVGAPGSEQAIHAHPDNEQVFVVVRGLGRMTVGNESREVEPGSLIFIPPGQKHIIRNVGIEPLVYVSATAPPFETPPQESGFAYVLPK